MIVNGISVGDKGITIKDEDVTIVKNNKSITLSFDDLYEAVMNCDADKIYIDFTIHS